MSELLQKFRESMKMDYIKWHDGIGYDLDILRRLPEVERQQIENELANHCTDWRDVEALDVIGTRRAQDAIFAAVQSADYVLRISALEVCIRRALVDPARVEAVLLDTLAKVTISNGMSSTLRLVEKYPSPAIRRMLLRLSLEGHKDVNVHTAALLYYLYGRSFSSFDFERRDLFLRFNRRNPPEDRMAAYQDLCRELQIDPQWAWTEPLAETTTEIIRVTGAQPYLAQEAARQFYASLRQINTAFLLDDRSLLYVARRDTTVIGCLYGYILERFDRTQKQLFLYSIDVMDLYRRQGVGKALINAFLQNLTPGEYYNAFVFTNRGNQAAMQLYSACGASQVSSPEGEDVLFRWEPAGQ